MVRQLGEHPNYILAGRMMHRVSNLGFEHFDFENINQNCKIYAVRRDQNTQFFLSSCASLNHMSHSAGGSLIIVALRSLCNVRRAAAGVLSLPAPNPDPKTRTFPRPCQPMAGAGLRSRCCSIIGNPVHETAGKKTPPGCACGRRSASYFGSRKGRLFHNSRASSQYGFPIPVCER